MKKITSLQKTVLVGVVALVAVAASAYGWLFVSTAGVSPASAVGNPKGAVISAAVALICGVGVYFVRHHENGAGEKKYE